MNALRTLAVTRRVLIQLRRAVQDDAQARRVLERCQAWDPDAPQAARCERWAPMAQAWVLLQLEALPPRHPPRPPAYPRMRIEIIDTR